MRKSTLKKLFQETGDRLNSTLLENRQLRERLEELQDSQKSNNSDNDTATEIAKLQSEIEALKALLDSEKDSHAKETEEIRGENEQLQAEINRLKGENFDLTRYSENLKTQLQTLNNTLSSNNTLCEKEPISENQTAKAQAPIPEPPKITLIQNAEEKDADAFEYASSAISEAVMKTAAVKYTLQNSKDPYSGELITLLFGKNEMFKADVLQTVMTDLSLKEKQKQIDKALSETTEYFDSILGQLGAGRPDNAEHRDSALANEKSENKPNTKDSKNFESLDLDNEAATEQDD